MHSYIRLSALFLIVFGLAQLIHAKSNNNEFYCTYYQSSAFDPDDNNLLLGNIDPKLCDNVIVIDRTIMLNDDTLELFYSNKTYKRDLLKNAMKLRKKSKSVRIFIESAIIFDNKLVNKIIDKRVSFVEFTKKLAKFVSEARVFDGFVIRNRFNVNVNPIVTGEFFKALRDAFHARRLAIFGNMSPFDDTHRATFPYLDRIIVNDRDTNAGSVDKLTHVTALFRRQDAVGFEIMLNKDFELDYFLFLGAPRDKVLFLVDIGGIRLELTDSRLTTIGSPRKLSDSYGNAYWSMKEICRYLKTSSWSYTFDEELAAPYAYNSTDWVAFDNFESYKYKMEVFRKKQLRGVVIDSLDMDDMYGKSCDSGKFPFTKYIKKNM